MFRFKFTAVFGLALALGRSTLASVSFTEDFSTNPFTAWSFGIGSTEPSTNRFVWNSSAASAYAGDPVGALDVHLDSSLPTVRFQRPLGVTLTDTNDFLLKVRFSFTVTTSGADDFMQITFGFVNSALTGSNRTGTTPNFDDRDTFHTIEFDYFPQLTTFGGPTLTPTVIGASISSNADIFANFASIFGPPADLGDNTNGLTTLPQNVTLQAVLAYTAANKTLTLTMSQVNSNGTLTWLDTGLVPMDLVANGYNTNFPFKVDTLAIMAYLDAADSDTSTVSLVADLNFQKFSFYSPPPEAPNVAINIVSTNVVLTLPTISNYLYEVQSKTDLVAGSWSAIASNIVGTGGVITNIDVGAATAPARFYRVGLVVP